MLKPTKAVSSIALALNAPIEQIPPKFPGPSGKRVVEVPAPEGCVRDLGKGEHRRVTFVEGGKLRGGKTDWSIGTEIVRPPTGIVPEDSFDEDKFEPDKAATVGTYDNSGTLHGVPFEEYVGTGASIEWLKPHVCIRLDHERSHQQLWVLYNPTSGMHNFHIHQMKFRLATRNELIKKYHINPPKKSHTCDQEPCSEPDYKFYEEDPKSGTAESEPVWHDTIPVPTGPKIFLIMSFDAKQQIGQFVFHCHILKHEDHGLMAPIEVWDPFPITADRSVEVQRRRVTMRKYWFRSIGLGGLSAIGLVLGLQQSAPAADNVKVEIVRQAGEFVFNPVDVTIAAGQSVEWFSKITGAPHQLVGDQPFKGTARFTPPKLQPRNSTHPAPN